MPRVFFYSKDKKAVDSAVTLLREAGCTANGRANFADALKHLSATEYDTVILGDNLQERELLRLKRIVLRTTPTAELIEHTGDLSSLPGRIQKADFDLTA